MLFSYLTNLVCVVFLVVVDEAVGRSVPFVFLERVRDDFMKRYGASINAEDPHPLADEEDDDLFEDRFSIAYQLDREFGYVLVTASQDATSCSKDFWMHLTLFFG